MASLDAHQKPWMWPWDACWLQMPGERHAGRPRKSNGSGLGVALMWPFRGFRGFRGLERFRHLRAGKRQAWTPIKSYGCALGRLLAANAWPTAVWTAQKKQWIWHGVAFACAGSP